jgi:hypothetical protein
MQENTNRTEEKICPNCRGGNAPAAEVCQWCGYRLDSASYSRPAAGYTAPPTTPEPKRKGRLVPLLLVLVVACVVLALAGSLVRGPGSSTAPGGSTGSDTGQQANASESDRDAGSPAQKAAAGSSQGQAHGPGTVGETLETAGLRVTLNDVRRSAGGDFFKPKAGNLYVVLDLTFENTTDNEAAVSSLLSASLKDSTGQKYTLALGGTDKSAPDGSIATGDRSRGEIAFEVPTTATGLVYTFDPILGGDPIRFRVD